MNDLHARLDALSIFQVPRRPIPGAERLRCITNCIGVIQSNPNVSARLILGWAMQENGYAVHAILAINGQPICITPAPTPLDDDCDYVLFAPDTELWPTVEPSGQIVIWRRGERMPSIVHTGQTARQISSRALNAPDQMMARFISVEAFDV